MARRRGRGDGSVYFDHANRSWVARVSLGTRDGKRVGRKVHAPTEKAAQAELGKLQRLYGIGGEPSTQTLDEYLADWLRDHGPSVRPSTLASYAGHVKLHISPLLGGIPVIRLRPSDVRRLIADRLSSGLAPSTVVSIATTLGIALAQAHRDGAIPENPVSKVRMPRVERHPVPAMTEAQALAITDATRGTAIGTLVVLLLGSGLRIGEALGLDWGDVDIDGRFVRVRVSKTTVRAVPISDDAADALRQHQRAARRIGPREPVFLGVYTSHRMRADVAGRTLHRTLAAAGLPIVSPHGLRHGAATLMVTRGVHMRVIAEQLGHRDPSLTARVYSHVVPHHQAEAVRVLNRERREA